MQMHDITKNALRQDLSWDSREGFIVVWSMMATRGARAGESTSYIWGRGPSPAATKLDGWSTAKHAVIYPTYAEAPAQITAIIDGHDNFWSYGKEDIRVVKIRVQPPVVVLDDMPADLLQHLAGI